MTRHRRLPRRFGVHVKRRLLPRIHSSLWMEMSTPTLKVWLVDGGKVRDKLLEDFVLAGHDKVYNFVPNGEVWVEDSLSVKDMNAVLAHELHERKLMSGGMSYDNAHSSAEKVERRVRGMPAGKVDVKLKELVALNS